VAVAVAAAVHVAKSAMRWRRRHFAILLVVAITLVLASFAAIYSFPLSVLSSYQYDYSVEDWKKTMQRRIETLEAGCNSLSLRHQRRRIFRNRGYIKDDASGLAYCHVPKAASTWWLTALAKRKGLSQNQTGQDGDDVLHRLMLASAEPQPRNAYFKMTFVRHPLRRLASAFVSKFVSSETRDRAFLKPLLRFLQRRPDAPPPPRLGGQSTVGFPDFVDLVIDELSRGRLSFGSLHWTPASWMCDVCSVK